MCCLPSIPLTVTVEQLIIDKLDLWTSATTAKATSGRGRNGKLELTGLKKLRELILELAVRGKLVPQDPTDEPASVLLEKIAAEKARLVKEGKIKKPKALPEITEDEKPFELPEGWIYCRLNDIGTWGSGATPKRGIAEYYDGGIPWFKSGELSEDFISISEETITEKALNETSVRLNSPGDVLIAMYGATIGKSSILKVQATTNQAVCACTPWTGIYNLFLLQLLKAYKSRFVGMGAGGAQPNISREKIIATTVVLPPTAEQRRIVEKVDELMALCDRIENRTLNHLAAHETLVDTLLDTLTQADSAAELADSWNRLAAHFDTLFTTEHSINRLKQTILQLAVMGRLVPQDPTDEPASVLLEKIAAEKARLVKEGKIKKPKVLDAIGEDEKPFELPISWRWCRLADIAHHSEAGWSPQCDEFTRSNNDWGVLKVSAVSWGQFRPEENKNLSSHLEPREELEIRPHDFLISRANTAELVARSVVVPAEVPRHLMMSDKIIRFIFSNLTNVLYINLVNSSQEARNYYSRVAGGTSSSMKNVSRKQIQMLCVPLPPLAEQHRIVQKVDALMALCDQLKARLAQADDTRRHLATALVDQAIQ
ncbi:MAG: restriction endonuclease subunit S [Leptolyngbya sp.]|nr:MAG: restriction endonuclease subunit S [Leptolyngbya sp.]